jgi:hypothetical protein
MGSVLRAVRACLRRLHRNQKQGGKHCRRFVALGQWHIHSRWHHSCSVMRGMAGQHLQMLNSIHPLEVEIDALLEV